MATFLLYGAAVFVLVGGFTISAGWRGARWAGALSVLGWVFYWAEPIFEKPSAGLAFFYTLLFGLPSAIALGIFAILGALLGDGLQEHWRSRRRHDESSEHEV